MAGFLDQLSTRVSAILTGTYPASPSPYITAGAFTAGQVFLPHENPRFPTTAKVATNRLFDLAWGPLAFDPPGSENGANGPWIRSVTLSVRVQYAIVLPPKLAPTDRELALGALEQATRRALDDAAVIQWALLKPGAFSGLAVGVLLDQDATAEKVDSVRAAGTTRVRFLVQQSIASSPGLWT